MVTQRVIKICPENIHSYFEELAQLDKREMDFPWDLHSWLTIFEKFPRSQVFGLVLKQELIGFSLYLENDGPQMHLLKIAISRTHRSQGLGRALLKSNIEQFSLDNISDLFLEVSVSNTTAIKLYENLGFIRLVEKKSFYSNGDNAYAMQLLLN